MGSVVISSCRSTLRTSVNFTHLSSLFFLVLLVLPCFVVCCGQFIMLMSFLCAKSWNALLAYLCPLFTLSAFRFLSCNYQRCFILCQRSLKFRVEVRLKGSFLFPLIQIFLTLQEVADFDQSDRPDWNSPFHFGEPVRCPNFHHFSKGITARIRNG